MRNRNRKAVHKLGCPSARSNEHGAGGRGGTREWCVSWKRNNIEEQIGAEQLIRNGKQDGPEVIIIFIKISSNVNFKKIIYAFK